MDFKQLKTFREIVRTGSVSQAARSLGRTQPAISHMLSKLESDLGMRLFERRAGRLLPVPEADYLVEQASRVLDDLENIKSTMSRMKDAHGGSLRIVSMPGPAVEFLPALISEFCTDAPEIDVTLLSRSSEAVLRLIEAQQFDLGLADRMPKYATSNLTRHQAFEFRRVCAVPTAHILAKQQTISLKDLSGLPLAVLFSDHTTTRDLRGAFDARGLQFRPRFEGQFFLHLLPYVARGLAFAVVDPIAQASWQRSQVQADQITFLPIAEELRFVLDLITPLAPVRSRLSHALEEKISAALRHLQAMGTV